MSTLQFQLLRSSLALNVGQFYYTIARMHNAKLYAASNQMQVRDIKQLLENPDPNFRMKWPSKGVVLDVGCGPGDVTSTLLRRFIPQDVTIIGGDISQDMIDYANATYRNDRTLFKCLNIESDQIWNEWKVDSCDAIVSFYCMHWIQDQQRAANNIYGLLKQGGEFLALFLGKGSPFYKLYEHLSCEYRWTFLTKNIKRVASPYQTADDPAQYYGNILTEAKFQGVQVKQISTSFLFPTKAIILDSILAVDPLFKRVPQNLKEDYKETIMNIVLERKLARETEYGGVEVNYSIMLAKGSKK